MKNGQAVEISPLRIARHLRGMSAKDLASIVGKTGSWISQLERGTKEITPEIAEEFSRALKVPGEFLLAGPVEPTAGVLHFRHKRRTPAAQRHRVFARALLVRQLIQELEAEFEELYRPRLPEIHLPGRPGDPQRMALIDKAAKRLRREWGMGDGPIPDLVRLVEVGGIWVIGLPPEDRAVDAYSWWGDGHAFIALNPVPLDGSDIMVGDGPRNAYRERFNVAHELGHLLLHQELGEEAAGTRDVELEAHRFAASFLVPSTQWITLSPRSPRWEDYKHLAQRWGVSTSVLLRRDLDLGIVGYPAYQASMIRMSANIGRKAEGRFLPPRVHESPGRLRAHLETLAVQGGVHLEDLAQRMHVHIDDLQPLVEQLTQRPPQEGRGKILAFPGDERRSG